MSTAANYSVKRDSLQAALAGSLRGFAATGASHIKRYPSASAVRIEPSEIRATWIRSLAKAVT